MLGGLGMLGQLSMPSGTPSPSLSGTMAKASMFCAAPIKPTITPSKNMVTVALGARVTLQTPDAQSSSEAQGAPPTAQLPVSHSVSPPTQSSMPAHGLRLTSQMPAPNVPS